MSKETAANAVPWEDLRLNQRVVAKPSPLHGKGCFARVKIPRGAFIGTYAGPVAKRNGRYVLWVTDEDGTETGIRGLNTLRYLNHSSKPNAEFDGPDLYALRAIRVGEEITFNYDPEGHGQLSF